MEPLQFVNVTRCEAGRSKNTHALGVSEEDRRRIRIQVQRDFRRKEKQRRSNANSPQSVGSPLDSGSIKKPHNEELFSVIGPPSQIPSSINAPDLWLDSLAHSMIEDCYPRENGSMHVLENNVAYSYHMKCDTPMRAIREALSCLHVGSTLGHQSTIHEGMKRYVCAINCLREDAAQKKPKMTVSGLTMVGMGILLCQVRYISSLSCWANSHQRRTLETSMFESTLTCCEEICGGIRRLVPEYMAKSHHRNICTRVRKPA
jgi:hypothetical protein